MEHLFELLDIKPNQKEVVCFVGAGGKTSSMFNLAQELKAAGRKVLVTTTTAIYYPQPGQYDDLIMQEGEKPDIPRLMAGDGITVLGRTRTQENKLLGVSPVFIDLLSREGIYDYILVEGDGSKGRPVKAPAEHEPVIPGCTTRVIGLIGMDCLDKPINDDYVHRPEIFCSLVGCDKDTVDLHMLVSLIQHQDGLFKGAPPLSQKYLILNKSDLAQARERAEQLKGILAEEGADIGGIILASMKQHTYLMLQGKR